MHHVNSRVLKIWRIRWVLRLALNVHQREIQYLHQGINDMYDKN